MTNEVMRKAPPINALIHNEEFIKKAQDMLGGGTQQFMSSILSLVNSDNQLAQCNSYELYNCCLMAAALRLSFNKDLGSQYQGFVSLFDKLPFVEIRFIFENHSEQILSRSISTSGYLSILRLLIEFGPLRLIGSYGSIEQLQNVVHSCKNAALYIPPYIFIHTSAFYHFIH